MLCEFCGARLIEDASPAETGGGPNGVVALRGNENIVDAPGDGKARIAMGKSGGSFGDLDLNDGVET